MASGVHVMEKPIQLQHQHQPHEPLKCPRCDSSNTKFCYYNNYSLSQPRHFCKACKRYWTRGGTLRNVPVGGGCRKNKRVKRPVAATSHGGGGGGAPAPPPPSTSHHHTNPSLNLNPNPNLDLASTTSNNNTNNPHLNSLFYGLLPQNPNYNPRFDARVSGYDLLQPHMNATGLGFPGANSLHGQNSCLTTSFSSFNTTSMYGGGNSTGTMASLLASSLNQQQRFMGFASYDDSSMAKDLKMEGSTHNRMDQWSNNNNCNNFHGQNDHKDQIEGVVNVVSSDPNNPLLWDTTTSGDGGGWLDHDPTTTNIGSSVPSLI